MLNLFYKILNYKYETHIKVNINEYNIYNMLIGLISSNISVNNISYIHYVNNIIILRSNKNLLSQLQNILGKYIDIKVINNSDEFVIEYEYIISINNIPAMIDILAKQNIYNLEHKYNANIKYNDTSNIIIYSDNKINSTPSEIVNMRIMDNNGPESFTFRQVNGLNESLSQLLNNYKQYTSYPILQYNTQNNTIVSMSINDNILILQLNEQAFFQATEIFKKHKYHNLVIEIGEEIYGQCILTDVIKQRIYLKFDTNEQAENMHRKLLYITNSISVIKEKENTFANEIYKIIMLIFLLILLIFFAIRRRKYFKYILIISIFLSLSYTFKISYYTITNLILVSIIDYLIEKNAIYQYILYLLVCAILLYIYQLSYMYNAILLHNSIYSLLLLLFQINNINHK